MTSRIYIPNYVLPGDDTGSGWDHPQDDDNADGSFSGSNSSKKQTSNTQLIWPLAIGIVAIFLIYKFY